MSTLWKRMCCGALLLAALASLGACGSHETPVMNENALRQVLVGKTWILRKIVSRDFDEDPAQTIKFNADGTVEGFGGCNAFTGTYTLTDDDLEFGPLASTHKSCGPGPGASSGYPDRTGRTHPADREPERTQVHHR